MKPEEVKEALKVVQDPEIGINIVDLGLLYDVDISEDGKVRVVYTLTSAGCPAGAQIDDDIKEAVAGIEGISDVQTEVTLQPPWSPEKMSELARSALGFF